MNDHPANRKMIAKLMFRLLPIQVVLAAAGSVNGIVSGVFASRLLGVDAMSVLGLYAPIQTLLTGIGLMLAGGSVILCAKHMGRNEQAGMQNVFSLDLAVTTGLAVGIAALFLLRGTLGGTGALVRDEALRPLFDRYLLGQAAGVPALLLGVQIPPFLTMENRGRRTMRASLIHIAAHLLLTLLLVVVLDGGIFGLALASSLGLWVFLGVEAAPFLAGRTHMRLTVRSLRWRELGPILRTGAPGALGSGCQAVRGLLVNRLILLFVGSAGLSAFAAADTLLRIVWAFPTGMLAVSRLLMSVSFGEEDRQTLCDIFRVMLRRFVPLMCAVAAVLILAAVPLTRIYYRDPADPVFRMTAAGLRILPLCLPLSVLSTHFSAYGQVSGRPWLAHGLSLLDGVVCAAGFAALLIRPLGMPGTYLAFVLSGAVCLLVVLARARVLGGRFPRSMEELLVLPADFGVPESERLDLTVRSMDEVVQIARHVQDFCLDRGVDPRRAYLAGLSLEEMAGNVVAHGFTKSTRTHAVDVRVVHKNDDVILRLRDDCVPFDPGERQRLAEDSDVTKNIGIRMVFRIARDIQYRYLLGLNVLTIRI